MPDMTNNYGLDVDYFHKWIRRVLREIDYYTPDELARELARMAVTANPTVLKETEFQEKEEQQ